MAGLTALDLRRVELAAEDHLADWYGPRGLFTFGRDDAIRYTAEGPLGVLCDRYGLPAVWQAVEAVVDRRPDLLTAAEEQRRGRADARRAACEEAVTQAKAAVRAGDFTAALAALDRGAATDPDHRVDGFRTWEEIRDRVQAKLDSEGTSPEQV